METEGRLRPDIDLADIHGQFQFNFEHAAITPERSKSLLDWAFRLDFERNGPSLFRLTRTMMVGWRRYCDDHDPRIRERMRQARRDLSAGYGAALWAMEKYLRQSNRDVSLKVRDLRLEIEQEFGSMSRTINRLLGPVLLWAARREARRFPGGRLLEPPTIVERRNWGGAGAS